MCTNKGVWDREVYCEPAICPDSYIPGGSIKDTCTKQANTQCDFECGEGYQMNANNPKLHCRIDGTWQEDFTQLCQYIRCTGVIDRVTLHPDCQNGIGHACTYTCEEGFKKVQDKAMCTNKGVWDREVYCEPAKCPDSYLPGGSIKDTCTKQANTQCDFECGEGYQMNANNPKLHCRIDGTWQEDFTQLCQSKTCDDTPLANGALDATCTSTTKGSVCTFLCQAGFTNSTSHVICTSDHMWLPLGVCIASTCPHIIPNGHVVEEFCLFRPESECRYACNNGFEPTKSAPGVIKCLEIFAWNETDVCTAKKTDTSPTVQDKQSGVSTAGFTSGIIVLVVIVVALVIIIVFIFLRRKKDLASAQFTYGRASFRSGGGDDIAIENPGYHETKMETDTTELHSDAHEYHGIDPSQMNPVSFEVPTNPPDAGFVNPLYTQPREPLPEVGHVTIVNVTKPTEHKEGNEKLGP